MTAADLSVNFGRAAKCVLEHFWSQLKPVCSCYTPLLHVGGVAFTDSDKVANLRVHLSLYLAHFSEQSDNSLFRRVNGREANLGFQVF